MRNRDQTTERVHQFLKSAQFTTSDHIIIFSGAGMSAESGISTFREKGGLWEEYAIEEVATPEAWARDPQKVLNFYNMRRKQLLEVEPNEGHYAIAELQREFNLQVITQNVDDLHERAGAEDVLHLHGELRKARSTAHPDQVYPIEGWELNWGDHCDFGSQLRPHVVWFGEMVPAMDEAIAYLEDCALMIVIGSSLQVYPAASLVQMIKSTCPVIVIDPQSVQTYGTGPLLHLESGASEGMNLIQSVLKSF
ncbi:SIR2 family NAD-dependent protein deacylase [Croceimicrobium sp.]|uniref:SIR2 family NAD-dependent protein deacylase n=1 Tax=Croceimicrobium sp. TaxID=2828340 RepID=UPI003BABF4BB